MQRREFITLLGGTVATWPLAAHAQQPAMPVIGFLNGLSPQVMSRRVAAYRDGLAKAGFVEGRNVAIEFRWADGEYDRLPELAADLVSRQVAVIAAGSPPAARAAKAATSTIPIVFTSGDDPVQVGLVSSLNQPAGNVTGVHLFLTELSSKRLGLLRDLLPQVKAIAALLNPTSQSSAIQSKDLLAAGPASGFEIDILNAGSEAEIKTAFATLAQRRVGALIVASDPFFFTRRSQLTALEARIAIPAVHEVRDYVEVGGLMSYGTDLDDGYRLAAVYAGRILKGEKPADLPVQQSTKFEFVINLKTAKALGLTIPPGVLAIADEVIE
jgi:putative ABC transport system substrate-binding protein